MGTPEDILNKPGRLTPAEEAVVREHPVTGERILTPIIRSRAVLAAIRGHHERWDGGGYPDGLAGTGIPLAARLFAVADALDAMTTDRPYRRALPWELASEEIVRLAGSQFDPRVVEAFEANAAELREIGRALSAA